MAEKRKVVEKKEVTVTLPVVHAPGWLQGFVDFVREQGVIGFAVGLILGLASKSVVDSFVFNVVNPVVGVILGGNNLDSKFICLNYEGGACVSKLSWGRFVSDIISFFIIAAVVYFLVKGLKLDRLDKKKEDGKSTTKAG